MLNKLSAAKKVTNIPSIISPYAITYAEQRSKLMRRHAIIKYDTYFWNNPYTAARSRAEQSRAEQSRAQSERNEDKSTTSTPTARTNRKVCQIRE